VKEKQVAVHVFIVSWWSCMPVDQLRLTGLQVEMKRMWLMWLMSHSPRQTPKAHSAAETLKANIYLSYH
jgi:hypothetical protein